MGLEPVLLLFRKAWLLYRYSGADVLSPYAAELVIKRATLKGTWK